MLFENNQFLNNENKRKRISEFLTMASSKIMIFENQLLHNILCFFNCNIIKYCYLYKGCYQKKPGKALRLFTWTNYYTRYVRLWKTAARSQIQSIWWRYFIACRCRVGSFSLSRIIGLSIPTFRTVGFSCGGGLESYKLYACCGICNK